MRLLREDPKVLRLYLPRGELCGLKAEGPSERQGL